MALQTETGRTPDELAADLAELSTVDWRRVWAGYGDEDPIAWCSRFGWDLVELGRSDNPTVRLATGRVLRLSQNLPSAGVSPISLASIGCWRADAQGATDNPVLFAAADEVWPGYLATARGAVGEPAVVTAWDDPSFPDLPFTPGPEERFRLRQPYRLALWSFTGATLALFAMPSDDATAADSPGAIQVKAYLRPDEAGNT